MTDLDLERLGDVWRQPLEPGEVENLKRTAELVRRQARWAQLVDLIAALAVAGVVLFLVVSNPRPDTAIVGGGAIVLLLYGHYRRRRLRQEELRGLAGSPEQMLDDSIARVEATLKRTRFGLVTFAPAVLVGIIFAHLVDQGSAGEFLPDIASRPGLGTVVVAVAGASLIAMAFHLLRSIRRATQELQRLTALRDAYRKEGEFDLAE
ncbi:MAG: hypothetical protein M3177_05255 [Pseudomonadota bacterium]|nr:hypothetical protein [Pseudomonadota bacterium]